MAERNTTVWNNYTSHSDVEMAERNTTGWNNYTSAVPPEMAAVCLILNLYILVTNIFVILTFRQMGKLSLRHLYMLGLVGSDLVTVVMNTINAGIAIKGGLTVTDFQCNMIGIAATSAVEITSSIHSAMCIDRWYSVQFPLKYRAFKTGRYSRNIVRIVITSCFLAPVALNFTLLYSNIVFFNFDPYIPICVVGPGADGITGIIISAGLFIFIPPIIQASTNGHILRKISKLRGINRKRLCNSIRTVLITVLVYYICYLPTFIWSIWHIVPGERPGGWFTFISVQMLFANSGMSFPIYFLTLRDFREHFLKVIQWPWAIPGKSCSKMHVTEISRPSITEEVSI